MAFASTTDKQWVRVKSGDGKPTGDTLADAVDRLIFSNGRSPSADVVACLSLEERALYSVLAEVVVHGGAAPPDSKGSLCHLAVHESGRFFLSLVGPQSDDLHSRAWVEVSAAQLVAIECARAELAQMARAADAELGALLDALSPVEFTELIHQATDAVDHNDPVQIYVDDALFSNVERFNNLLARPGCVPDDRFILNRLAHTARADLSLAERRFLALTGLLRHAGLSIEEFNGRQFTPWAVSAFFEQKCEQYARLLTHSASTQEIETWPQGLADQAACLGRLKRRLAQSHCPYRWIDGFTLRKEERWRPRSAQPVAGDLPAVIRQHCLERFAVSVNDSGPHDAFFLEVVRRIAKLDGAARSAAFEALLEAVVRAAMQELSSPIGMTRGMRDLRHFQDAIEEGRFEDVCVSPLDDGYCAVFAREETHLYEPQPLAKILTAISRRMQFNHRHYLPGHFDAAAVPTRPHFYYPPTMGDIAENGEHRHPGHALVRVRYSLRSPAPLRIAGRAWAGLVDIRLMRAVGHPYTEADLAAAGRYTDYIRAIAQAALMLKSEGLRAPMVTGFERADYERRYPSPAPPELAASAAPRVQAGGPAIGPMLRRAMAQHGATGAVVCAVSERKFSLADIQALAALLIAASGVSPGSRVVVACGDRTHQAVLIVAGLAAGYVVCPLDHSMAPRALEALMRHAAPDAVVTDAAAKPLPASFADSVLYAEGLRSSTAGSASLPEADAGGLLIYTSGVTGVPKGVLLNEQQLGANVAFASDHFGYTAVAPWTSGCLLPLHHTFAIVSDVLPVLCAGGCVVVLPGFTASDAGALAAGFNRHAVQSFSAVPIVLDTLLALRVPLPASLVFAISGAAPLLERSRTRYLERYGHPVLPCYGLTESVCFASASPLGGGGRAGSAGRAAGISIRIVGEDLQPLGIGEQGEIALRGSSVITHYAEPSPVAAGSCFEDGWFLTGDMGRLDDEGYLYITGRRKNMLIRGGEKLYLEDLDRCLEEHPTVAEACSVQVPGRFGLERAVAFVVATKVVANAASMEDELRAYVCDRLGPLGVPDALQWTDRIPRSATGKPLRDALRARCAGAV